ncbi:hypothetical protein [Uliginosibacterium sp. H1]|uniref:hypothetical protein n=1 Tax=Uliginosibacterium sp. H1 TaxID=3114757 RepID=UPI002E19D061|nr:hypothetical protein [Uliginosibacterium sp. H1]
MTSEVLILNKRAVVIGADSAVTTSGGDHPRYSKSANKIFELTKNGSVAAAIYGSALIDMVPWELVIKLFRSQLGAVSFGRINEYGSVLISFLNANEKLFPKALRNEWVEQQFDLALKNIFIEVKRANPTFFDQDTLQDERAATWKVEAQRLRQLFLDEGVAQPLTQNALDELLQNSIPWVARAQSQIDAVGFLGGIDATDLAELGHRMRYSYPELVLQSTGLVVAGYGEEQIFPAYEQVDIFGHIGDELYFKSAGNYEVTHTGIAMIKPLAQTSMIDMFTDGFGRSLEQIIEIQSNKALASAFDKLEQEGVRVAPDTSEKIRAACHKEFMIEWKRANWKQNFNPLIDVLQTLNVQEMAHLAESLLNLESLKERVTSASESVGGPIDVAAITKSEGLVWIKRKHYFDAGLNVRYMARLQRSLN